MSQGSIASGDDKRMRLRYAGNCRLCGVVLPAGQVAIYERTQKTVRCDRCPDSTPGARAATVAVSDPYGAGNDPCEEAIELEQVVIDSGVPGGSARREHERRRAKKEADVRTRHPRIGGLILALQSDPQSTTAWATGAEGEEQFGAQLNSLVSGTVRVLHDRRIPTSRANIDHLVVCPAGVIVIDAKKYRGRPQLRVDGGILRPRTESLLVGSRNCTKLVDGVLRQVDLVRAALVGKEDWASRVDVRGMLCFVDADWPLIGGSFSTRGIDVVWPKKAVAQLRKPGPVEPDLVVEVHRHLASYFPPA